MTSIIPTFQVLKRLPSCHASEPGIDLQRWNPADFSQADQMLKIEFQSRELIRAKIIVETLVVVMELG